MNLIKLLLSTTFIASFINLNAIAETITGAGATFPSPLYSKVAQDYKLATGHTVLYQAIGSGGGIRQIDAQTVDFGASDMPLRDQDLISKSQIQFPTALSGVVPVINIPGIQPGQLRLTGELLGDIFLGKITKWDDSSIKSINPSLNLPDAQISPVRRSDGSGTTFLFTNYLSKVNADWKLKVGEGTAVNWPLGSGGKGNEGVANLVSRVPYSIGYVEYAYAKFNRLTWIILKNAAGNFVPPNNSTFASAGDSANWSASQYQILTNQSAPNAWPIVGATYIIISTSPSRSAETFRTLQFFEWFYKNGDASANNLDYIPLSSQTKNMIADIWRTKISYRTNFGLPTNGIANQTQPDVDRSKTDITRVRQEAEDAKRRQAELEAQLALAQQQSLIQAQIQTANATSPQPTIRNQSGKRVALVIGNAAYTRGPLVNPVNDANDISTALKQSGFQVLDRRNVSLQDMRRAVREFGDQLLQSDVGLVYYSGHGVEAKGKNYLIPVNADIQREDEIADQGLDVDLIIEKMNSAKKGVNILIVDACRDNPFARSFRSSGRGLAQMDAPTGTIIAFATAPGKLASDGTGRNSPYTKNLVKAILKPNLPIESVLKEVRRSVVQETNGLQTPWESSSLIGDFYFRVN